MSLVPQIFIGLPVFNGASHIAHTLECLKAQTFSDWKILISDNCSNDGTAEICRRYASMDSRISYVKQQKNIGMVGNYQFVLEMADSPFFMWAAYDDHWEPDFLQKCLEPLQTNKHLGMSFCNIFVFTWDSYTTLYDCNLKLLTDKNTFLSIWKYMLSPEGAGKANLIYSIYRTNVAKEAFAKRPLTNEYASDAAFTALAIAIAGIQVRPEKLFGKRMPPPNTPNHSIKAILNKCLGKFTSFKLRLGSLVSQCTALKGTPYYILALYIACARVISLPLFFVLETLKIFPGKHRNYKTITPPSAMLQANG